MPSLPSLVRMTRYASFLFVSTSSPILHLFITEHKTELSRTLQISLESSNFLPTLKPLCSYTWFCFNLQVNQLHFYLLFPLSIFRTWPYSLSSYNFDWYLQDQVSTPPFPMLLHIFNKRRQSFSLVTYPDAVGLNQPTCSAQVMCMNVKLEEIHSQALGLDGKQQ